MPRLPFKAMQVVESVVRLGSFAGAARELGLSESAISNSVRRFERDLGLPLFDRRGGRVRARRSAVDIAAAASEANGVLRSALDGLHADADAAQITVASTPTFATRWLAARMPDFESSMAPTKVAVSSRVAFSDEADLWVRHGTAGRWPGLETRQLMADVKAPVAAPSLVGDGPMHDREIAPLPLISVAARPDEWPAWFRAAGLDDGPAARLSFDVTANCWEAAIAGTGVALGNLTLLGEELRSGALRPLGTTHLETHSYFICRRRGDNRSAVMRAWEWFRSQLG